jgi:hypothetical protein
VLKTLCCHDCCRLTYVWAKLQQREVTLGVLLNITNLRRCVLCYTSTMLLHIMYNVTSSADSMFARFDICFSVYVLVLCPHMCPAGHVRACTQLHSECVECTNTACLRVCVCTQYQYTRLRHTSRRAIYFNTHLIDAFVSCSISIGLSCCVGPLAHTLCDAVRQSCCERCAN